MEKTAKAFRLAIKREKRKQPDLYDREEYFHHVVATNYLEEEKSAQEVLTWHNQRGKGVWLATWNRGKNGRNSSKNKYIAENMQY